jgi:hypothetical protein
MSTCMWHRPNTECASSLVPRRMLSKGLLAGKSLVALGGLVRVGDVRSDSWGVDTTAMASGMQNGCSGLRGFGTIYRNRSRGAREISELHSRPQ